MKKYDYIITGMGASGLMLAHHLISDPYFDQKKILMIDRDVKDQNDRTWCFWEKDKGLWNGIITKEWNNIYFGSQNFSKKTEISPYTYKMIRSKDFYNFVLSGIKKKSNITIVYETLLSITQQDVSVQIETDKGYYLGSKVFNSVILSNAYKQQKQYPVLNQHFVGWFIKTSEDSFDDTTATFMDFTVAQKGNTRFMYVLPMSKTEALFEYTLFSETLLEEKEYEDEIKQYLHKKGIASYEITEKETGCIPMTCYDFRNHNSKNIIHIGTAGGWTKPSTGFTFSLTLKNTRKLTEYLKKNTDLSKFGKRTKFWYYDLLFIDLLYKKNAIGASLFSKLFEKNKVTKILKFLDEESTFLDDIGITTSLPAGNFLKALWHRVF